MTDWGAHMIDIVLLAMRDTDPLSVAAAGGKFFSTDDRDTPDTLQTIYRFPKWVMNWEHRCNNGRGMDGGHEHGAEFIGDKGPLIVDRSGYQFFPEGADAEPPGPVQKAESTHWQNFLDCVKSRKKPASDIDSMAKTTMMCHLGNIALQSGKTLQSDAVQQDISNRGDAKNCVSYAREYRSPWKLTPVTARNHEACNSPRMPLVNMFSLQASMSGGKVCRRAASASGRWLHSARSGRAGPSR